MSVDSTVLAGVDAIDLSSREAYALWAPSYDRQLNPLLTLEERVVVPLIPALATKRVLDAGCGTGRWLLKFAQSHPQALWGVDTSPEMLAVARTKVGDSAVLSVGSATELPIGDGAIDFAMCSFLASYIDDIAALARELRRTCRSGAMVVLTDVHPNTTQKLGWKRAFRSGKREVVLKTWAHTPDELKAAFCSAGFELEFELEPEFGTPERQVFAAAGKTEDLARAFDEPAILVLGFQLSVPKVQILDRQHARSLRIVGARVALDAYTSVEATVEVNDGRIATIATANAEGDHQSWNELDLSGYLLLPGMINAHDHLEFSLFPRLGNRVYESASEWALDIYRLDDEPIRSLRKIEKSVRLMWGGIRNLLSGVTTVCHHNDYAPVFDDNFPVRVLRRYAWAHSLAFDGDMHARTRCSSDEPFFVHLGEGTNAAAEEELWELDRRGLLDRRTVLIHALAVDEKGLQMVRERGAAIVWCPSSNLFLFGRTLDRKFVDACPSIALGSDSPLTCAGDLLDEIRAASQSVGIPAVQIYAHVTRNAANVLRLCNGEGAVRIGATADLIAVPYTGVSPADALVVASYCEIEMVLLEGEVKLVSPAVKARFAEEQVKHLSGISIEGTTRWIDAPVYELLSAAEAALGSDIRLGGKRISRA